MVRLLRPSPEQEQGLAGRPAGRVQLGQQAPLRAAICCRVSAADQSCARRERDLAALAARSGYEGVGTCKETASGVTLDRAERRKILALAQRREIDVVLVTELSRWGRSTTDLLGTLKELEARRVSLVALNGMAFDLATPHGRMMATLLAGIAEFERELTVERIRSGIAAARARGKKLGRQPGQRPKSDRLAPRSHHWARRLAAIGHRVRLIPPQYVKPYVKRSKADQADAEAICEAAGRPSMRFVPFKSAERQGERGEPAPGQGARHWPDHGGQPGAERGGGAARERPPPCRLAGAHAACTFQRRQAAPRRHQPSRP